MSNTARFRFYGSLNDFLSPRQRNSWISYGFKDKPAVKDAIEALGVPHPEVRAILANHSAVDFAHALQHQQQLEVYPAEKYPGLPENYQLREPYKGAEKFILDVHLGKLAKALRMLGFDCYYENNLSDQAIAAIAERENRIVLTRDLGLLKHRNVRWGYWLRSQKPNEQLEEVIKRFKLNNKFKPLTRCLACNELIEAVSKESVLDRLPPKTRAHFHEFFQCRGCRRVYWKGSHYEHMQEAITQNIRKPLTGDTQDAAPDARKIPLHLLFL